MLQDIERFEKLRVSEMATFTASKVCQSSILRLSVTVNNLRYLSFPLS